MTHQCFGRTKSLQRCGRSIDGWLCGDHKFQPIFIVISLVVGLLGLCANYSEGIGNWVLRHEQDRAAVHLNLLMSEGRELKTKFESNWEEEDPQIAQIWVEKVTKFLEETFPQFTEHFNNDAGIFAWHHTGPLKRSNTLQIMSYRLHRLSEILMKVT